MKYKISHADDHWFRENVNCQFACPVNTSAMHYIERIKEGNFDASLRLNFIANLFPHILGRVCTHPCESACRRGRIDKPIAICSLKRSSADFSTKKYPKPPDQRKKTGKRVAVIGSGPSGLAVAHDLAIRGHEIVIFEALPVAGGMLTVGIPAYRLPREDIEKSINWISEFGVELRLNHPIDTPDKFSDLLREYDAVYLATGAHKSTPLDIPGEDFKGVLHGVSFMRETNLGTLKNVPDKVAVIGGGFTAIDCARSSLRLGAKEVSIIYRRSLEEMPAGELEVQMAEEEGIKMHYLTSPVRVLSENGQDVTQLECIKNKLGEFDDRGRRRPLPVEGSNFMVSVDMVIAAIGQVPDVEFLNEKSGIEISRWGMPVVDNKNFMTARKGIFAGGDCITGPRSVIEVIADGRKAAKAMDTFLTGRKRKGYQFYYLGQSPSRMSLDYEALPRQTQSSLPMKERWCLDAEAELGFTREKASTEAERCLLCHFNIFIDDKCILCGGCVDVCPYDCISMVSRESIEEAEELSKDKDNAIPQEWDAAMVIDEEKCIRCGLCVKRCPTRAITMVRFAYSEG